MLKKLDALEVFCTAAETLQFKETANRLAVSPPVVTRVIAELEAYLGEALFVRNTRQVQLTDFGESFLPQAQQLLDDSERLFLDARRRHEDEMSGVVRVTAPVIPDEAAVLTALFQRLSAYPEIQVHWLKDTVRLNVVASQIDIGIRVGTPLSDGRLIVRHVGTVCEKIVAAPALVARLGMPETVESLRRDYPLSANIDENSGRVEAWSLGEEVTFTPRVPLVMSNDMYVELAAARAGRCATQVLDWVCEPYLANGELVELLDGYERPSWAVYLYRPQRHVTPKRVRVVFDCLVAIMQERLAKPYTNPQK